MLSKMFTTAIAIGFAQASWVATVNAATAAPPTWEPAVSVEKLIQLAPRNIEKTLSRDFAQSGLSAALKDVSIQIRDHEQVLEELQQGVGEAQGETKIELSHHLLLAQQRLLELMKERSSLKQEHLQTRRQLVASTLQRMQRQVVSAKGNTQLVSWQQHANQRFQEALPKVEQALQQSRLSPQSRYAHDYANNLQAIEALNRKITAHSESQRLGADGQELSGEQQLQRMLINLDAGLALIQQERQILALMATTVKLDAQQLSNQVDPGDAYSDAANPTSAASALRFFIN